MSPRPRQKILDNLESIYREAYDRARAAGDQTRMADLDAAYQREQLLLEVLLDVRDALTAPSPPAKSDLKLTTAPAPPATRLAWPIWTPLTSASSCCSRCCSTCAMP